MIPTLTCLALACVGSELGYQQAPDGGLELIFQISPDTFRSLGEKGENDSISLAVWPEAQQWRPSRVTLVLGNGHPPRKLPAATSSPPMTSAPGTLAAPAAAPIGPAAPMPAPSVLPTTAAMPLPSAGGPALGPSGEQGPVRVGPPAGASVVPRTTNEASQGAADPRAASAGPGSGQAGIVPLPAVNNSNVAYSGSIDGVRLLLILAVIALAASNGYVGWLFYDARQRYLGLLSQKFATAK
jgi:hypothetical protein